jgi:hypothetical protein
MQVTRDRIGHIQILNNGFQLRLNVDQVEADKVKNLNYLDANRVGDMSGDSLVNA